MSVLRISLPYLIQRSEITLIGCEPDQVHELVAVLGVTDGAEFEGVAIYFVNPGELLGIFICDTCKHLQKALDDNLLDLLQECSVLERLTRNIQWKVLRWKGKFKFDPNI